MRRFYIVQRLIARALFLMDDNPYDLTLAKDRRWLLRRFKAILNGSKHHVYVSQTKARPLLYQGEFRDALIERATRQAQCPADIRVLVHRDHSDEFGYWDSSFRITDTRIGDFVIGDAGALLLESRNGILFKIRDLPVESTYSRTFESEYAMGDKNQQSSSVAARRAWSSGSPRRRPRPGGPSTPIASKSS